MKNKELVDYLLKEKKSISCAESMTGGMFAKYIVDIPGTSECFERGLVTYSNSSKIDELFVKKETIERFGAISKETAMEMAEGLYKKTRSNICISVSGNAGPYPAEEKDVGLYYVGLCIDGRLECFEFKSMEKDRNAIREDACSRMFDLILSRI